MHRPEVSVPASIQAVAVGIRSRARQHETGQRTTVEATVAVDAGERRLFVAVKNLRSLGWFCAGVRRTPCVSADRGPILRLLRFDRWVGVAFR